MPQTNISKLNLLQQSSQFRLQAAYSTAKEASFLQQSIR